MERERKAVSLEQRVASEMVAYFERMLFV